MRVLVVDDDEQIATTVRTALEDEGFTVDVIADGNDAFAAASALEYDAIVLDVMLPGQDGVEVSRKLRAAKSEIPILMLTALDDVGELVTGLAAGADDYVSKPFAIVEVTARVKALVRRRMPGRSATLEVGRIVVDTIAHRVTVDEATVQLTAREYEILEFLIINRGRLVTRNQVLEHVWGFDLEGGDNLVEVMIGRIRRKIAAAGAGQPITTIRGSGYRFD